MTSTRFTCTLKDMTITLTKREFTKHTTNAEWNKSPRMYISIKDESILDNLANRKRRPYNVYKTMIHDSLLSQIFDLGKLQWSQYAGCSCPCSPGFVLPHQTINMGGHTFTRFDVWIEFGKSVPAVDETKAPRLVSA